MGPEHFYCATLLYINTSVWFYFIQDSSTLQSFWSTKIIFLTCVSVFDWYSSTFNVCFISSFWRSDHYIAININFQYNLLKQILNIEDSFEPVKQLLYLGRTWRVSQRLYGFSIFLFKWEFPNSKRLIVNFKIQIRRKKFKF